MNLIHTNVLVLIMGNIILISTLKVLELKHFRFSGFELYFIIKNKSYNYKIKKEMPVPNF